MPCLLIYRCLVAWLVMLLASIANGVLREVAFTAAISELAAHQISTLTGDILLGLIIWQFVQRFPPVSGRQALAVGCLWLVLTVGFEFGFFHYVAGHSWSSLQANYDLTSGRLWVLLLAWITLSPYLFFALSPAKTHQPS